MGCHSQQVYIENIHSYYLHPVVKIFRKIKYSANNTVLSEFICKISMAQKQLGIAINIGHDVRYYEIDIFILEFPYLC